MGGSNSVCMLKNPGTVDVLEYTDIDYKNQVAVPEYKGVISEKLAETMTQEQKDQKKARNKVGNSPPLKS